MTVGGLYQKNHEIIVPIFNRRNNQGVFTTGYLLVNTRLGLWKVCMRNRSRLKYILRNEYTRVK